MWGLCALAALACQAPAPPAASPGRCRQPVVLVTIDGVRPDEVLAPAARAWLPNLYQLIDRGVGLPVYASGPNFVSLPGYLEILTGRPARACTDNACGLADEPTLLDELRGLGWSCAAIASWEIIEHAVSIDPATLPVSAGRHGGVTRASVRVDATAASLFDAGADSLAFPGVADYRPDRYTGPLGLAYLLVQKPCFFYIELGDTDEYAHRRDYPSYLSALTEFDDFLGQLDATLLALHRDAIVIVTTDHGRAADFGDHGADEPSSHAWVVAAGGPLPSRGLRVPAAPRHLRDIAPTLRLALGLPPDGSAFAGSPLEELLAGEVQP